MSEFFSKLQPFEVIALITIAIFLLPVSIVALSVWRRVRVAQAEADLKRSLVERGFSADELERLFRASTPPPPPAEEESPLTEEEALHEIALQLSAASASGEAMQQAMAQVRAGALPTTQAIAQAVSGIAEGDADKDQMLGAIRGLCRPAVNARELPAASERVIPHPLSR